MPHMGQRMVIRNSKRLNWLRAGRRWRKTTLLMSIAVEAALRGEAVFWGAPTYKQFLTAWHEFRRAVGETCTFKKNDQEIWFPTGGTVILRSMDSPDNARGLTAYLAVLDEAPFMAEEAYYEVVKPMLLDTQGPLWALGTPNGRNWYWRETIAANDDPDAATWQIPTVGCRIEGDHLYRERHPFENPDIPFGEMERLFATMPADVFRQEFLAEFMDMSGSVFRNIRANLYSPNGDDPVKKHKGHMKILTADWARHNDYTVFDVGCGDCHVELEMDRFSEIDYATQRERLKTLYEKWEPEIVLAEANAMGEPVIEQLWEDGIAVQGWWMSAQSKPGLIRTLATALERGSWKFLDDKQATLELEAYEQKISATSGHASYSAPKGMNDDTVIARALLVHAEANMGHIPMAIV